MSVFNYKEHRSSYVEDDPDLKLNHKMFSTAAVNAFVEHNSSPRSLMMSSHISQAIVIDEPEEESIQTGIESELAKYTVAKTVDEDSEILSVIKRYTLLGEEDKVVSRLVVVRSVGTGVVDVINIPYHNAYHPYFGFKYNLNEELDSYVRGDIIAKDTKLAYPPTNLDTGGYGIGRNINVAQMTLPEVDEDGFVVSKSAAKKFKFKLFDTRTIEVGEDSFLLNMYGDDEDYKPFPEIGEYVNDDSVIAVARKYDPLYGPCLYSKEDVKSFNPLFDEAVYTRGGRSKVVDIKVYYNPRRKKALPTGTERYCAKYSDALIAYYKQIVETYDSLNNDYRRMFNKDITVSNNFNMLLVEAYGVLDSSFFGTKVKKTYRKEVLDLYRIEFTLETQIETVGIKSKLTDFSGNKGVIVDVWEDEDMPVDADGNRAEIIMDPKSTVSRLNVGRLYERAVKASMAKLEKIVIHDYASYNVSNVYDLTTDQLTSLFSHPKRFMDILGNKFAAMYDDVLKSKNREAMISVIEEIVEDRFRIVLTLDNDKRKYEIVDELQNSIYAPTYGKVSYNYNGKKRISKRDIMIAPMYIILLSKIADSVLTTSSAKANHFGIPVVSSKADRYRLPSKNSPVRTQGETEGRIYASYGGRKLLAELKDLNTSVPSHTLAYNNILTNVKPTNIDNIVNRKVIPYGSERGLTILNSLWNAIGMGIVYQKESKTKYKFKESEHISTMDINNVVDLQEIGLMEDKDED